jgi:hypothetical protein
MGYAMVFLWAFWGLGDSLVKERPFQCRVTMIQEFGLSALGWKPCSCGTGPESLASPLFGLLGWRLPRRCFWILPLLLVLPLLSADCFSC